MSMSELQIGAGYNLTDPPAIIGEAVAGRAAKVKSEIKKLIKAASTSTFDLAELLHEVKTNIYFREWGFDTFGKYAESLAVDDLKTSKSYYLVRIVERMKACEIDRKTYETVGLTKLRVISKLDPEADYKGTPGKQASKNWSPKPDS
jgi:hypothetical protein